MINIFQSSTYSFDTIIDDYSHRYQFIVEVILTILLSDLIFVTK